MSYVLASSELVQGAAQELAGIGAAVADATAAVSGPTTAMAAAAQDEISTALASLFGNFGRQFQVLSSQAQAFHTQFANQLGTSAAAYASAEIANAEWVLPGGAAAAVPAFPYQTLAMNTVTNASAAFGATRASLNTFAGGVVTGLRELATNPTAFFGNLRTAAQSVFLVGAPPDVASAVVQRTLGGVTQATNPGAIPPDPTVVPVNDVHVQLYQGLTGLGDFQTGSGWEAALVAGLTEFAASPASGVLLGAVGPVISPAVALWNSAGSILADLTGGAPTAALGHLIDTPSRVADAFFNGATLNLDALAPTFGPFVTSGSAGGEQLDGLSFAFGGLFSPGEVVTGASGPLYRGTGGSMLNALGLELSFFPPDDFAGGTLSIPATPVGPIAAIAGLVSILGQALGGTLS